MIVLGLILSFSTTGSAQNGVANVPLNYQPLVSFQASAGAFFWNAREVHDSMPSASRDHLSALNSGIRYGGDILVHFQSGISLGASYRQLSTSHITEPNHWNIPVTDSNNHVIQDPNTGGLLYGPRYGSISESISLWFYGFRLTKEFELQNNFYLGISIAPGIVNFLETGDFVGYRIKTTGANMAVDLALDGKFQFDRNWSALVQLSLFNGSIPALKYTDPQQQLEEYTLSEPQSVLNYSINLGIRFTINRKDQVPDKPRDSDIDLPYKKDNRRFQLAD